MLRFLIRSYGIPNGQDDGTWPNVMIHIGATVKLHGSIL